MYLFISLLLSQYFEPQVTPSYVIELSILNSPYHSKEDRYYLLLKETTENTNFYDSIAAKGYSVEPLHIPVDPYDLIGCCKFGNVRDINNKSNLATYGPLPDSIVNQVLFNSDLFKSKDDQIACKKLKKTVGTNKVLIKLFKVNVDFCSCSPEGLSGYAGYEGNIVMLSRFNAEFVPVKKDRDFLKRNLVSILNHPYIDRFVMNLTSR